LTEATFQSLVTHVAALCERDDTSDVMMKRIEQECMEALLISPDSSLFYTLARFGWNRGLDGPQFEQVRVLTSLV
jgi:hypothetical protein